MVSKFVRFSISNGRRVGICNWGFPFLGENREWGCIRWLWMEIKFSYRNWQVPIGTFTDWTWVSWELDQFFRTIVEFNKTKSNISHSFWVSLWNPMWSENVLDHVRSHDSTFHVPFEKTLPIFISFHRPIAISNIPFTGCRVASHFIWIRIQL